MRYQIQLKTHLMKKVACERTIFLLTVMLIIMYYTIIMLVIKSLLLLVVISISCYYYYTKHWIEKEYVLLYLI